MISSCYTFLEEKDKEKLNLKYVMEVCCSYWMGQGKSYHMLVHNNLLHHSVT